MMEGYAALVVVMETMVVVMLLWKQDLPARMNVMRHVSFGRYSFTRDPDATNCEKVMVCER